MGRFFRYVLQCRIVTQMSRCIDSSRGDSRGDSHHGNDRVGGGGGGRREPVLFKPQLKSEESLQLRSTPIFLRIQS